MADKIFRPDRLLEAMNGMSNSELAEKLGCARSNITMYLAGTRNPSKIAVQLISLHLGVAQAWLMGFSNKKFVRIPGFRTDEEYLPDVPNHELLELVSRLTSAQKELLIAQMRGMLLYL